METKWIVKYGYRNRNPKIVRWSDHGEIAKVSSDTDAKLIAAAPELLEVIRTVYSRVMNTNINTEIKDMGDTWELLRTTLDEIL